MKSKKNKYNNGNAAKKIKEDPTVNVTKAIPARRRWDAPLSFLEKIRNGKRELAASKQDQLLRDDMSEFEKELVRRCREDGMPDNEIQAWLKQL